MACMRCPTTPDWTPACAHLDLPKSIEGYYQETGRAGRDGEPAEAWLAYGLGDAILLRRMIAEGEAGEERKRLEHAKLDALIGYCESTGCRRQSLLAWFGETHPGACGRCDNCLHPPQTWDATEAARKALSCAYRTGQRFGAAHLIDVLRGADTAKVRQFGHQSLSTYGIGADLDGKRWRGVFRQLVAAGHLEADPERFGALRLTATATALLRGEQSLHLRLEAPKRERERSHAADVTPAAELPPEASARFDALRQWRSETAKAQNVPAYVIFHDSTLRDIAREHPRNLTELAAIAGVGAGKLERYEDAVLALLAGGG